MVEGAILDVEGDIISENTSCSQRLITAQKIKAVQLAALRMRESQDRTKETMTLS